MMAVVAVDPAVHRLDGEIDQHDRVLGDDAHQHQDADDDRRADRLAGEHQRDDGAADRQRQREQDGDRLQEAVEQHDQHDETIIRPSRIAEPKPSNSSCCSSASPASLTEMPGGRLFITGSALMAALASLKHRVAHQVRLDACLPLAVEPADGDRALAELNVADRQQRHAAAARGRHLQLLEHLAVGARALVEQHADRDQAVPGVELRQRLADVADGGDADRLRQAFGRDAEADSQVAARTNAQLRPVRAPPSETTLVICGSGASASRARSPRCRPCCCRRR